MSKIGLCGWRDEGRAGKRRAFAEKEASERRKKDDSHEDPKCRMYSRNKFLSQ